MNSKRTGTGFLEYFNTMKCIFHNTSFMQNVKYSLQRKSSSSQRGKEGLKVKEQVPVRSDRMSESRAPPCPWLFIFIAANHIAAVIYLDIYLFKCLDLWRNK